MQYADWGRLVRERFPVRDPADAQNAWDKLKQRLSPGQSITGIVIAKAPFGAWLDIGVDFPTLLLIPDVEGLTSERYRLGDWCPIGATMTTYVAGFNDRNRQIVVRQVNPEHVMGNR